MIDMKKLREDQRLDPTQLDLAATLQSELFFE